MERPTCPEASGSRLGEEAAGLRGGGAAEETAAARLTGQPEGTSRLKGGAAEGCWLGLTKGSSTAKC